MKHALSELRHLEARAACGRLLIATNFDGTLCPYARHPDIVHVAPATVELLRRLTESSRVQLAVISGRTLSDVAHRLRLDCIIAGNHGLEIKGRGIDFRHSAAESNRPALESVCGLLRGEVASFSGAWVEDKGLSATVHYRKVDPRLQRMLLIRVRRALAPAASKFAMRSGRCALEVRPRVGWDKGAAVRYISERAGVPHTVVCIGDDRTDETMFRANPGGLNVRVGATGSSSAQFYVTDPSEVIVLLSHILEVRGPAEVERMSAASG